MIGRFRKDDLVECIARNSATHVPMTVLGEPYEVIDSYERSWVKLRGTIPPNENFKFNPSRFRLVVDHQKRYPTIDKQYFKI